MKTRIISLARPGLLGCLLLLSALASPAQYVTQTGGGWFIRGTGTSNAFCSMVIPLDGEQGVAPAPTLTTTLAALGNPTLYHWNETNAGAGFPTNSFVISNAVAAFGAKYGGSPLYTNQVYNFAAYGGDYSYNESVAMLITVVTRSSGAWTNYYQVPIQVPGSNDWSAFILNGASVDYSIAEGLAFTVTTPPYYSWGLNYSGEFELAINASAAATNYEFTFWTVGGTAYGPMVSANTANNAFYAPLYTLSFDAPPPLLPPFVHQPQYQGKPMPPTYEGKSLTELLAVKAVVTNAVSASATNWLDIDTSPELRYHPALDQLVMNLHSNAFDLAAYVFNQIQLTDGLAWNGNTNNLLDASVNLGGLNRSAYSTYMEGQGSPTEQCALLVYLLRRAGVPAAYIFGPNDGVQMLDSKLSDLLQMQIHGLVNGNTGQVYTTNSLISVNYPWVAAYVNGQWLHLFPWIKDTEMVEGLNLYDYMPLTYGSGNRWVRQYLHGDTRILNLSAESDAPSTLFPLFVQAVLLTNAPGVSLDDIGMHIVNRQVQFTRWSDFPTPFAVTNGTVLTVHDMTSIATNSGYSAWSSVWDTMNILVYSQSNTNHYLYTGDLRVADLQDRKFLLRTQTNTSTTYNLILSLAPFAPSNTTVKAFTDDASLTNQQTMTLSSLTTSDDLINVVFTRKRHRMEPAGVGSVPSWNIFLQDEELPNTSFTSFIRLGDLAAICLHSGRVSKQMLTPWAQEYWTMQQQVAATPSLTNTISPDITQGTLPYLMGMSYFERICSFKDQLAALHKVQPGTMVGVGLSILGAKHNSSGVLTNPITLYHPHVDMEFQTVAYAGNQSMRPDENNDIGQATDSFLWLFEAESSAQEHKITEDFYAQAGGISSVRLLLEAQQAGGGILELNIANYLSHTNLAAYDANMWASVVGYFNTTGSNYTDVYITTNKVTDTTVGYSGMGAIIHNWAASAAIISVNGQTANGGWGMPFLDSTPFYNPPDYNFIDLSFDTSSADSWSVTYSAPTISVPSLLTEQVSYWDVPTTANNLVSTALQFGGVDTAQQLQFNVATFNLGLAATNTFADAANNGGDYDSHIGPEFAQLSGTVADPVNLVTGEFYITTTDLNLPGPMPLFIQRNYSSQNVDMGDSPFGTGWRPAYTPYLRLVTNGVIYAAELDGTVVAYRQPVTGTNSWVPTPADNLQLNNRSGAGIGSTANLFNNGITTNTTGGTTNFVLTGADGSVRVFQWMSFPIPNSTTSFSRTRPYLQSWTDANGNSYTFTYLTDNTQPDYGQVLQIRSSNGNFLGFYYDVYGHITQAYTEDGRWLFYDYDSHGDLVTVTLPDESQINYTYQHTTTVTNSVTNIYSTHLISQEQKPDGRTLANTYDTLRRVTTQAATVGSDLSLVTNATFVYSNSFTSLTNSIITGTTWVFDVFGHTNIYQYTSNMLTGITDPLGQTETMIWFTNSSDAGYYPHSLKSRTDKRGLSTAYQYDSHGNLAQTILTGNLTGGSSSTETATNAYTYTTLNRLSTATDPVNNQTAYYYTNTSYPFLPTAIVRLAGSTPVSTNQMFYTSVSQTVTNGAVIATNNAYGLVSQIVRGGFATNAFGYDGRGFKTAQTNFTGTGDPAVTKTFFHSDRGELVQEADASGRFHLLAYDPMGRVIEDETFEAGAAIPLSGTYSYYNDNGDLVWVDGPRYNPQDYTWMDYDSAGRKITQLRWRSEAMPNGAGVQASSNLYAAFSYRYDPFNNLTNIVDPLGNFAVQGFDVLGRMTRQVFYSASGTPLATNLIAYEPGNQVAIATNAIGGVTTKQYTSTGKLKYQQNPDGSTNSFRYDLSGRMVTEYLRNGDYWQSTYSDASLTVTKVFNNSSATLATNVTVFDPRGNVVQFTDNSGNTSSNLFDGLDRLRISAGPLTITVSATGLSPDSPTLVTNIAQEVTTRFYDASGQTLIVSNALGETITRTNDALGRPIGVGAFAPGGTTPVRLMTASYGTNNNSVTITSGSGSAAIVQTSFMDNEGHTVLTVGYPASGVSEFVLQQFDLAGNFIARQQCSSNSSGVTVWATNGWTYDGLNRVATQTTRDGAIVTFSRDALGDVTNRAMPGGLNWSATYLNDGRISTEQTTGGSLTNRSLAYTYYSSGSPFVGLVDTVTDGRGTIRTNAYDDFLRLASVNTTGSADEQKTTTTYAYDPINELTNLVQYYSTTNPGPATALARAYDANRHLISETVSLAGYPFGTVNQGWDLAGRRAQLNSTGFSYQADGLMTGVGNNSGGSLFNYANNGLLSGKSNVSRIYNITGRDGSGRVLSTATTVGATTQLLETNLFRGDGRLTNYTAVRGDFTDVRNFTYSSMAQRLTQESFKLNGTTSVTNTYAVDGGTTGGLGILTSKTASSGPTWTVPSSGGLDGLSREAQETDNLISRSGFGYAPGAGIVTATLNGRPVNVDYVNNFDVTEGASAWRADLDLFAGVNTLVVSASDPNGIYTGSATSVFTVTNTALDTIHNTFNGNGNVTQRVWVSATGVTNRVQTITWDAFDRQIAVTDRDTVSNGFNWHAVFDGLGRRLSTDYTMVVSNFPVVNPPNAQSLIQSQFDPEVEFLETAVNINGFTTSKTHGPDVSGTYGGMQGVGGVEAVRLAGYLYPQGVVEDYFGNVVAVITSSGSSSSASASWNPTRFSSYGPVQGYQSPALSENTPVVQSLGWRGRRIDETGTINIGARQYGWMQGCWMSPDPLWAQSDSGAYTMCGGDPVNLFDPTGRFGKAFNNNAIAAGFDPNKDAVLNAAMGPSFTADQLADGLLNVAFGAVTLPFDLALGQGSMINTFFTGRDDNDSQVSPGSYAWAAAGVLLPFMPVGELAQVTLRGIGDFGAVEMGIAGGLQTGENFGQFAAEGEGTLAGAIRNVNPTGGDVNCVNCSIATEYTLRGAPASALPTTGPLPISLITKEFGGSFTPVSGPMEIGSILSQSGEGASGVVFGQGTSMNHVWNVVNQGGNIRFLDGQIGGLGVQNLGV